MKLSSRLFLFLIGFFFSTHQTLGQTISNEGLEFWMCFPDHSPSEDKLATMSLFITAKSNSSGVVSCGSYSEKFSVAANTVKEIFVPRDKSFIGAGTFIAKNKGIHIKVDEGQAKVVVYAHVFAGFRSAATLVLPYEALGTKHFAMAYEQLPVGNYDFRSQLNVVAVEPNTTIIVKPMLDGVPQPAFSKTLIDVGDVYQYQNVKDVTGTLIEVDSLSSSCKRIAVFSGSNAVGINTPSCDIFSTNEASLDPLLQQLYPIDSWGKTFPLIPFYNRNAGSIYRVIAASDNTTVTVDGVTRVLNTGQFYSSPPINNISLIKADKPVSVAQFAISEFCSDSRNRYSRNIVGDPDMVILNPLEYSIDKITLYSSTKLDISEQYLNVTIPSAKTSTFTINNKYYTNQFKPIPTDPAYAYAQIDLKAIGGRNFSLAADTGFNAVAYGFGNAESYAYSAGTSLASTTMINALKFGTNEVVDIACIDGFYDFRVLLPYIPTKLTWKLSPTELIVQDKPSYKEVTVNNKKVYEFKLSANKNFNSSGTKNISVITNIPVGADVCSTTDEEIVNFTFEVSDLPVAQFTSADSICISKSLQFNFVDKKIGEPVASWAWDFGDGSTSTEMNPAHSYNKVGKYVVTLVLKSKADCISKVFEKVISVTKPLTPDFEILSPLCVNTEIAFADLSTTTDGGIQSWLWDFGDGATSNEKNPVHIFTKIGDFKVTLLVTSRIGCTETVLKTIRIGNPASVDFEDPASCISDLVIFKGIVKTGDIASWLWDFGDDSNDADQKTKQNPTHRYLSAGEYTIKLKAVSTTGCVSTISRVVKISGANPKPAFEVLRKDSLCSNYAVSFQNKSEIFFGNIVRLDIIYDKKSSGASVVFTDNSPSFDKIYTHEYPSSGKDEIYQVVFKAYSGQNCVQESAPVSITVHGTPQLQFDAMVPVCLNSPKFVIPAKETSNMQGIVTLEGPGVVENQFDPVLAGAGIHTITYTFSSKKGCSEQRTQTIQVYDIPVVDAGEDIDILLAGEKQIQAKVTGNQVSYKWTPSIGLSNDSIANPIASPTETTKYTLVVTSKDGCVVSDELTVTVHTDPMIPNAFSPNGDGINDTWSIKYLETFVHATIRIFNRSGQQVFFAEQYNTPWDGKYKNIDSPVGVYYYIIEPNNGRNRYTGSVTLLR